MLPKNLIGWLAHLSITKPTTWGRSKKRIAKGGILAIIGWILSPLTWWNDPLVNIPIAYGFGYLFSLISESLFLPFMIVPVFNQRAISILATVGLG